MILPTCPHCHTRINPFNLNASQLRIFHFIATHPDCTMKDIRTAIYAKIASCVVSVHIHKMRPKLRGVRIVCKRGCPATYRLVEDPKA